MSLLMDDNYHIIFLYFFWIRGPKLPEYFTYDGVQKLKLVYLRAGTNSEINEIATRLKKNKIRRKLKKIFQNWYSKELIVDILHEFKKEIIPN